MLDECDEYVCKTDSGNHQGEEIRFRCIPSSESERQIFTNIGESGLIDFERIVHLQLVIRPSHRQPVRTDFFYTCDPPDIEVVCNFPHTALFSTQNSKNVTNSKGQLSSSALSKIPRVLYLCTRNLLLCTTVG